MSVKIYARNSNWVLNLILDFIDSQEFLGGGGLERNIMIQPKLLTKQKHKQVLILKTEIGTHNLNNDKHKYNFNK